MLNWPATKAIHLPTSSSECGLAIRLTTSSLRRLAPYSSGKHEGQLRLAIDLAGAGLYAQAAHHREQARRLIESAVQRSPDDPLVLNDCAAAMAAIDELDVAIELLRGAHARLPRSPDVLLNLSVVLWRMGHYGEAGRVAAEAHRIAPEDADIEHRLRRIHGTLSIHNNEVQLLDGLAAEIALGTQAPLTEGRIAPLHVLRMSLPLKATGYSYRTQEILLAQREIGLDPVAVTDPFFPEDVGCDNAAAVEELEGILYHRLPSPLGRQALSMPGSSHLRTELHRDELREPLDEYLVYYARKLLRLSSRIRPSLLHSHSNYRNALVAGAVARALGIPHVYEVRGMWEESSVARGTFESTSDRYRFERRTETRCCEEADAVVTLSRTMKRELVSRGVEAEKIFLVPNGANPDRFPVLEGRCRSLARELGLGPGPVIGYAGSFSAYEGLSDLLRAFRQVIDVIPEARALIVGGGRDSEAAYATASELELGERVIFAGQVDRPELLSYYSLIDIFVVPRPPFRVCQIVTPLKPYEAMSTGRALVVSDVEALQEMIVEGQTAVSYKAGRPDSLAAACIALCNDPVRRRELGHNGAQWVRLHRSWTAVAAGYREAYDFALEACRRRRAIAGQVSRPADRDRTGQSTGWAEECR